MFRRTDRTPLDRILAAIEIPALGLWLGAACGFAFIFAPAAFHLISDLSQFAALTSTNLRTLALAGYVCGGLAIVMALLRSRAASDRTNDLVRAFLVLLALGCVTYEMVAIVPAMAAIPDLRSPAYHALHGRSSAVFGSAVLLAAAALVLAAVRTDS
jgi:hypothetical protein